jgi:hypothetical protein
MHVESSPLLLWRDKYISFSLDYGNAEFAVPEAGLRVLGAAARRDQSELGGKRGSP